MTIKRNNIKTKPSNTTAARQNWLVVKSLLKMMWKFTLLSNSLFDPNLHIFIEVLTKNLHTKSLYFQYKSPFISQNKYDLPSRLLTRLTQWLFIFSDVIGTSNSFKNLFKVRVIYLWMLLNSIPLPNCPKQTGFSNGNVKKCVSWR